MGCGGSKDGVANGQGGGGGGKVVPYDRRPKISVRIGPDVKKLESSPQCIFIFGGPGSRKGRVVDDLRSSYGFQFICGEDLIFEELPKKVSNVMKLETIKDIKSLLEEDPSHMTLEWLLTCIERRVELARGSGITFLVDIIPNLKYLLRMEGVSNDDLAALQSFEEKYPISFGLNLAIPVDKVLTAKSNHCAKPGTDSKMKKESGGQSDEADSSRTQKRAALYDQCAKPFLNYFTRSDRLVTVDVACGKADLIWHQVNDVMMDLDFHPSRVVNTVVVFGWTDADIENVDTEKYLMQRVDLRNVVENPDEDAEKLLVQLSNHLDNLSRETDSFVVSLQGTKLAEMAALEQAADRPITFMEVEEGYIETYLPGSPKDCQPQPGSKKLKAICSLENEVYLFPPTTRDRLALDIAMQLASTRRLN